MNKRRVNSLTYGALLSALLGVFLLLNRQLAGMFDAYMLWIIPLPVIVYCLKFDVKQGMIMGAAMTLLSFVVATPMTTFYVACSIVAGLIYSDGLLKGKSSLQLIISVFLVSLFIMFISTFMFAGFFGYNLAEDIEFMHQSMVTMIESMEKATGTSLSNNPLISLMLEHNFLIYMLILSTVLTSIMEGILVHLLAFVLLKRLKLPQPQIKPLNQIRAPLLVKVFVILTFVLTIANGFSIPWLNRHSDIIMGLMPIAYILCCFYGYLLALTWINWKMGNRNSRIVLVIIIVMLMMFAPPVMIGLGSLDMFTDARNNVMRGIRNEQNRQV